MNNQTAKKDAGKPKLTLVPREIINNIATIREYGTEKYGDPENWKLVEKERYQDAAFRHFLAYLDDNAGIDNESGLKHLWHLACNIAFLCEIAKSEEQSDYNKRICPKCHKAVYSADSFHDWSCAYCGAVVPKG